MRIGNVLQHYSLNIYQMLYLFLFQVYDILVKRIGNEMLKYLDLQIAYKRDSVCDRHFRVFCRIPEDKKLKLESLKGQFKVNIF